MSHVIGGTPEKIIERKTNSRRCENQIENAPENGANEDPLPPLILYVDTAQAHRTSLSRISYFLHLRELFRMNFISKYLTTEISYSSHFLSLCSSSD